MLPDISIVIPLYNKEKYVERSLNSVFCQTLQNFELIVIDSSTDTGTTIVDNYRDSRVVHILQPKGTAAQARNQGVRRARSDFIAFLDADDEWQPDHLEILLKTRKKFPDAGLYSTPYVKIKPDGRPMVMLFYDIPKPPWDGFIPHYLTSCSRGDEPVHSSSCAVPRNIFETMGGFPEDLVYGEDQFLWGKISLKYPIAYSWKGITIYHTEALGRICDEAHPIKEHPFAAFLRQELDAGNIPPDKVRECRAYIRRKRIAEIFSRHVSGSVSVPCETGKDLSGAPKNLQNKSDSSVTIIGRSLILFYNSCVHEGIRRFLCLIYGCYNPGELIDPENPN